MALDPAEEKLRAEQPMQLPKCGKMATGDRHNNKNKAPLHVHEAVV